MADAPAEPGVNAPGQVRDGRHTADARGPRWCDGRRAGHMLFSFK
ncbi:hypothetical protein GCM10023083_33690 [Streptomyces phyllanthi]